MARSVFFAVGMILVVGLSSCGRTATCADGLHNGQEEGVDCGGTCGACEVEATCDDGARNGNETDLDCGGSCEPCEVFEGCITGADCVESVCDGGTCRAATCDDEVPNGAESDEDCGGDDCEPCEAGKQCFERSDCVDRVCDDGECQEPECDDDVKNGTESDEDCGGECDPCGPGKTCVELADCAASTCINEVCELAVVVRGTTKASEALVGVYVGQSIVRLDFAAAPTATNFDTTTIELPVSSGTYVSGTIASPIEAPRVTVLGIEMVGATGQLGYQSIAPDYFGVIVNFGDEATATAAYNELLGITTNNVAAEIIVINTAP